MKTYKWGVEDVEILARVRKHSHVPRLCMFLESIVELFQQKKVGLPEFCSFENRFCANLWGLERNDFSACSLSFIDCFFSVIFSIYYAV